MSQLLLPETPTNHAMPFEILKRASVPSFELPEEKPSSGGDKPGIFLSSNDFKGRSRGRRDSSLRALRIKKTPTQSGFLFTVDLPETKTGNGAENANEDNKGSPDLNGKEAARGQRFANIFINSAKNISAKYNVLDKPEAINNSDPGKMSSQRKIRVSRASRNRAELVKATFEIKYHCVDMALEATDSENLHPNVEGVFNPLQVIRNRIVRQKLEHHSPSTYRTLPLACNAFSSHSSNGRMWSMVWGVELNDFVADFGWRQLHWNLLRNPKGELWFHDETSKLSKSKNSLTNLLDKLWDDKDTDSLLKAEDIILEVPIMTTRRKKTRATKRIRKNIKDKAKRFYGSGSAGSSILDQDWAAENSSATNNRLSSIESISRVKIDRVGRRSSNDASSQSQGLHRRRSSEAYGTFSSEGEPSSEADQFKNVPKIMVNDIPSTPVQNLRERTFHSPVISPDDPLTKHLPEFSSINDVSFSQVHLQKTPALNMDDTMEDEEELEENIEEIDDKEEPEEVRKYDCLALLNKEQRFLDGVALVTSYYLESIYPKLLESAEEKTAKLHDTVIKGLLHSAVRINDEYLPAQENLYRAFLDETNTLIHLANDKHAVRIDNLLSATDRSYNELNTSLLMDLRKVGEQLDKLNLKFFGNSVTTVLKDAQGNVLTNALQHTALYFILENLIVVVLRLVWIVANVSKIFWFFSKGVFYLISGIWKLFF